MNNQEFQKYVESETKGVVSDLLKMGLDKEAVKAVARQLVSTKITDQTSSKRLNMAQRVTIQNSLENLKI